VNVSVGDQVDGRTLASNMKFRVRDIVETTNVGEDTVTGQCLNPGASQAFVEVWRSGHRVGYAFSFSDDGFFDVSFGDPEGFGYDPANIHGGDKIRVRCNLATGDFLTKNFIVP